MPNTPAIGLPSAANTRLSPSTSGAAAAVSVTCTCRIAALDGADREREQGVQQPRPGRTAAHDIRAERGRLRIGWHAQAAL